ncbi:cobalamin-binding protein [Photobacterium jeanii]|uniref:Vitamin B12-binding protein n=1 Tax=Photobacterium jeanii TaxID=858640 RepID=A0A178KAN3_9GAMM|nr:vitamin B12 ABC transporter substrate-binding protein BtuF [Photobacterium jeanii]OAN14116.1 cobalamin-binding protein [Photobacterium jeanii]PST89633.1 vitamin B12 ABC transporter substrate-binding protein BtuF [Photobacterium jeanii]
MRFTCLLLLSFTACTALAAPAQRVISLSPHMTELAYAAGLGDKMVAASEYSDYPAEALELERVANHRGIKLERILALQPDLILAWKSGNPPREMAKLEQLGFNIFYSTSKELPDIANTIERLGQYANSPKQAQQVASDYRQQLAKLTAQYQNKTKVRYFYQISAAPMITVADGHWPTQVFQVCGGENIFAASKAPYPQVSQEQVVIRQPEIIFGTSHANTNVAMWQAWQGKIPAVDNQHVFTVTSDWLNRPTPRTIKAIKQVCDHLDAVRAQRQAQD